MKISKNRIEYFSDAIIAIIITIMVLDIPLPKEFKLNEILVLFHAIFVFFVSFIVVASQWNKHRYLFDNIKEITNKIIWRNFLFLFFLALLPIFTKWIIENPGQVVPAIGYEIIFLLLNFSYQFIWVDVVKEDVEFESDKSKMKIEENNFLHRFIMMIIAVVAITLLSISYPTISLILFLALPVTMSLFNLIYENDRHHHIKHD